MQDDHVGDLSGVGRDDLPAVTAIRELIMAGEAFRMGFAHSRDIGIRESTAISVLRNKPTSQQELARVLGLSPAAITSLVDRLEAQGLARRTMSSSDRRVTLVSITPLAEQHLTVGWAALRRCVDGTPGVREPAALELLNTLASRLHDEAARLDP